MDLIPFNPIRSLSRWPDFWEDSDLMWRTSPTDNLDIYETEENVVIKANVAGVKAEDVDITFEDEVLWIEAQREEEDKEDKTHYRKSSWSYSYKVVVPGKIDISNDPQASVEDGVLTVSFEKSEASKPKKVKVQAK